MDKNKAELLFKKGYNCAQSVFCAVCEDFGIDFETGLKLSSGLGGGMGKLREVCGAVSAMFLLVGLKSGYTDPLDDASKQALYEKIQKLAKRFENEFGSIICADLLGEERGAKPPVPTKRTENFYEERPCSKFVGRCFEIFREEFLKN